MSTLFLEAGRQLTRRAGAVVVEGAPGRTTPLMYPEHRLKPEDLLHFVELDGSVDDWKVLGLDVEMDLWALQVGLMSDPSGLNR